jgi:hypothetical protein
MVYSFKNLNQTVSRAFAFDLMHCSFEGRPNTVPDNFDGNERSEVQIALLLQIEVFRDYVYCYWLCPPS